MRAFFSHIKIKIIKFPSIVLELFHTPQRGAPRYFGFDKKRKKKKEKTEKKEKEKKVLKRRTRGLNPRARNDIVHIGKNQGKITRIGKWPR